MIRPVLALLVAATLGVAAAALTGLPRDVSGFQAWRKVVPSGLEPGGAHAGAGKVVYANAAAAAAWRAAGALPRGSVLVKTGGGTSAAPAFVAIMWKRADGWYYEEYFRRGDRYALGAGGPNGQALCVNCHEGAPADEVFTR